MRIELSANRGDASVHHVGGCDDARPRARMGERRVGQAFETGVVVDLLPVEKPAVAMIRVLTQTHVGDDAEIRHRGDDRARRSLYDAILGVGTRATSVLGIGDPEQNHAANPEIGDPLDFEHDLIDGKTLHPRHRDDGLTAAAALHDKEREDQILPGKPGLADHASQGLVAP